MTDRNEELGSFMASEKGLRMKRLMESSEGSGFEVRGRLEFGKVETVIPMVAAAGDYDLIVMATYKRTNVSRFVSRGVVAQVVASGACPVLIIHNTDARLPKPQPVEMVSVWNGDFLGDEDAAPVLSMGGMRLELTSVTPTVWQ